MSHLSKIIVLAVILLGCGNLFAQPADLQGVTAQFKKIDVNQDSWVTPDELQSYQAQTFQQLDKDNSKDLNAEELEADQTDIHKLADQNQDGQVTPEESRSQFNAYFEQMDQNQDGKVSEAEYTDYWKLIYKF